MSKVDLEKVIKDEDIHNYILNSRGHWQSMSGRLKRDFKNVENDPNEPGAIDCMKMDKNTCLLTFDFDLCVEKGYLMKPKLNYIFGNQEINASEWLAVYVRPVDNMGVILFADQYDPTSKGAKFSKTTNDQPFQREQSFEINDNCLYDPSIATNDLQILIDSKTRQIKLLKMQLSKALEDKWIPVPHVDREEMDAEFKKATDERNSELQREAKKKEKDKEKKRKKAQTGESESDSDTESSDDVIDKVKDKVAFLPFVKKKDKTKKEKEKLEEEQKQKWNVCLEEEWLWGENNCIAQAIIFTRFVGPKVVLEYNPKLQLMRLEGSSVVTRYHPLHKEDRDELKVSKKTALVGPDGKSRTRYDVTGTIQSKIPDRCGFYKTTGDRWHQSSEEPYDEDSFWAVASFYESDVHNPHSYHWYMIKRTFMETIKDSDGKTIVRDVTEDYGIESKMEKLHEGKVIETAKEQKEKIEQLPMSSKVTSIIKTIDNKLKSDNLTSERFVGVVNEDSMAWDEFCSVTFSFSTAMNDRRIDTVVNPDRLRKLKIIAMHSKNEMMIEYYEKKNNWKTGNSQMIKHREFFKPPPNCIPYNPSNYSPGLFSIDFDHDKTIKMVEVKLFDKPDFQPLPKVMFSEINKSLSLHLKVKNQPLRFIWNQCNAAAIVDHLPDLAVDIAPPVTIWSSKSPKGIQTTIPPNCIYYQGSGKYASKKLQDNKYLININLDVKPGNNTSDEFLFQEVDDIDKFT